MQVVGFSPGSYGADYLVTAKGDPPAKSVDPTTLSFVPSEFVGSCICTRGPLSISGKISQRVPGPVRALSSSWVGHFVNPYFA